MTGPPSAPLARLDVLFALLLALVLPPAAAWVVRLHVPPGAAVASATVDGTEASSFATLEPIAGTDSAAHRPFGGAGAPPAAKAGHVAEVQLRASRLARSVELAITY